MQISYEKDFGGQNFNVPLKCPKRGVFSGKICISEKKFLTRGSFSDKLKINGRGRRW